jgi:hypothetical protein
MTPRDRLSALTLAARLTLAACLTPSLALAEGLAPQAQLPCDDWRSTAQVIAEPWEVNTRAFANGEVRLAVTGTGEPAAGSYYLLIMSPPYGQEGEGRQCLVLSLDGSLGFAELTLAKAKAKTETATNLDLTIPAQRWLADTDTYTDAVLSLSLDLGTGIVQATLD